MHDTETTDGPLTAKEEEIVALIEAKIHAARQRTADERAARVLAAIDCDQLNGVPEVAA